MEIVIIIIIIIVILFMIFKSSKIESYPKFNDLTDNIPIFKTFDYPPERSSTNYLPEPVPFLDNVKTNFNAFHPDLPHINFEFIKHIRLDHEGGENFSTFSPSTVRIEDPLTYKEIRNKFTATPDEERSIDMKNMLYSIYQTEKIKENLKGMNSLSNIDSKRFFERELADNESKLWWENLEFYDYK
jgi:hypothetical protein